MRLIVFECAVGLAMILAAGLSAATFTVAQVNPQASDDGPGTSERPWKTIAKAAESVGPGDRVIIKGGVYRERALVKQNGTAQAPVCFEAAPGEHVVVSGADQLTGWRKADPHRPIYSVIWPYKFIGWNRNLIHPDDEYHRVIGRCEQVAVNNYLLRQVLSREQLAPGTFFVEVTNQTLWVWDLGGRDLNRIFVEAAVRQEIFRVEGDYVQVRGLRFRFAANMAQHGAVVLAGHSDVMEDCTIEDMNASGATFANEDLVVRRCLFLNNGQLGFGASRAHRLLFTECSVENNNTKGFDRGWEAGGDKLVLCRDAVLERSRFLRNRGSGIWFDIGNTNCVVRQCLIADNEDAGIFYEISYHLLVHDNVIVGNGFAHTAGAWGAQAGISLSSSPGCIIERNLIVGNREGFNFREQTRTTPTIDDRRERPVWNHDETIRHNLIALNRDAQVWGWFDVKDNRYWPADSHATNQTAPTPAAKPGDIAGAYAAKTEAGQPAGLTLESLRLRFENNVYFAAPGQEWFRWGPTWARNQRYASLADFQANLGIDTASLAQDPGFADVRQLDFRIKAEMLSSLKAYYPNGPVPGVTLGVLP
jgi:hypothetical protein